MFRTLYVYKSISTRPGLSHGRGGAWDLVLDFNRLLELPRNLPNRLLELPNYGLWQAKSFLFYRPEIAGCSRQTLQTLRNFQTG